MPISKETKEATPQEAFEGVLLEEKTESAMKAYDDLIEVYKEATPQEAFGGVFILSLLVFVVAFVVLAPTVSTVVWMFAPIFVVGSIWVGNEFVKAIGSEIEYRKKKNDKNNAEE